MPGPYSFPTDRVTGGPSPADDVNALGAALNEADDAATPNTLVLRDADGRFQAAMPTESADVATMGWTAGAIASAGGGGGVTLRGKAPGLTLLRDDTWIWAGSRAQRDGGWKDMNGVLALAPIDAGIDQVIAQLAFGILSGQATGTVGLGLWESDEEGYPTGTPIWSTETTATVSGDLKAFSLGASGVDQLAGERHWAGLVNLNWVGGGELHRVVAAGASGGVDVYDYGTDLNAAFNYSGNAQFSDILFKSGVTGINTNLTGSTYTRKAERPLVCVQLSHP